MKSVKPFYLLVLFFLAFTLSSTAQEEVNIALNRPAYASNQSNFADSAFLVTDGNHNTLWGAGGVRPVWLYIDLGRELSFNKMIIHWHDFAYPDTYVLQTSNNRAIWDTVYESLSHVGSRDTIEFGTASARFVRMYTDDRNLPLTTAIYEMEVWGVQPNACNTGISGISILNKPEGRLNVGTEMYLQAEIQPDTACERSILWSSSNQHIAYVDEEGLIKALSPGECYIRAGSFEQDYADSCLVKVRYDSTKVWELNGNYGIIQVENAQAGYYGPRWYTKETEFEGYSGESYITFQGPAMWPEENSEYAAIKYPRKLTFFVSVPDSGTYYYSMYTYHIKEDGDNDYWRSINKETWRKTGHNITEEWTWVGPCGWYHIDGPGPHSIEIAGRSNGMCIDRIAFYKPSVSPPADGCGEDLSAYAWANDEGETASYYVTDTIPPDTVVIDTGEVYVFDDWARIAWTKITDNIHLDKIMLYLNDELYSESSANSISVAIYGLEPETDYRFQAVTVDWTGNKSVSEFYEFKTLEASAIDLHPKDQLRIWPNPSFGELNIYTEIAPDKYALLNSLGQTVAVGNLPAGQSKISLAGFSDGVYYLKLSYENIFDFRKLVICR